MNNSAGTRIDRALLYRGDHLVLSIGPSDQLRPHLHGAAELRVSMREPIVCRTEDDREITSPSILIPPGVRHQNCCADGLSSVLYLDAESSAYRRLTQRMRRDGPIYVDLTNLRQARQALGRIAHTEPALEDCFQSIRDHILLTASGAKALDTRVEHLVRHLRQNPTDRSPVAALARLVGVSEDRLHHLFSSEVGIPIHRYRIWHRLRHATDIYFEGANLTKAAHEAGFADSAHFSRTFVNMFGAPPSQLLSRYRPERGS